MYRFFFIAKNNMKKQKKDMITFFTMTLISAYMIFLCLTMLLETGKIIDTLHEKTNSAELLILMFGTGEASEKKIEDIILGNDEISGYETTDYVRINGKYRHKGEKQWTNYTLDFYKNDLAGNIQAPSIDVRKLKDNEIIAPISLSTSFSIGDPIQFKIEDYTYEYKIAGFNEDTYYCSPMNLGAYLFFVTPRTYDNLVFDNKSVAAVEGKRYAIKIKDKKTEISALSDVLENEYVEWFTGYNALHPDEPTGAYAFLPSDMMYPAATILPLMFVAVMLLFAVIIFIIALVITDFSIKNFIMTNMKNTAIMEASGYTVREMILILLTQLLIVAGTGSIAGVLAGALSIGKVGYVMYFLLGLGWNRPTNMGLGFGVVVSICAVVALLTVKMGKDYKKTTVLDALRGGINAHNFKKNHFPFDKTGLPVSLTLAFKETFGRFKNQIGVIFIAVILTISAAIGFGLVDTFGTTSESVMNIAGMVFEDAESDMDDEGMIETICNMSSVEFAYGNVWITTEISKGRKRQNINSRVFTDTSNIKGGGVVEGRWPKHNNEVMLGANAARRFNVEVGDTVNVKYGLEEASYIVCGLSQTFNNMGLMAFFTQEGIERIADVKPTACEIKLKSNYTYHDFEKEFKEIFPDTEVVSIDESAASIVNLIITSMKIISFALAFLIALIISFVESLIIRTQINREWRNLGVSKALGYTSGQLIWQTVLSNMPSISIGVIIGLSLAKIAGTNGFKAMFAIFGYKKVDFLLSPLSYVLSAVLIVAVAMLTAGLKGRRIHTLEPVKMITEE